MSKKILIFILAIAVSSCATINIDELQKDFIQVRGTHFYKNSKPYYFAGTNLWYGCYLGSPGETGDRKRLNLELDKLKSLNINNLRVLAASEESAIKRSLKPAIQESLGVYNEDLLEGLDYLLNEMRKRKMYAVVFLNNYWEWTGGMGQYNAWVNGEKALDPGDFSKKWQEFNDYVSSFYRNEEANKYFRKFLKTIITRKNKFNGLYYYQDPTVMAWELANEPRPGNGEEADKYVDYYYNWINRTAEYIHNLDPNHLVTTGNEGLWGSNGSEEIYLEAHESPSIDYITFHLWAKNWSWFDAYDAEKTYPGTEQNAVEYIDKHIDYARKLNKPITLEEFGLPRNFEYTLRGTLTTVRDKYFELIYNIIEDSASSGAPIAGSNFWTWGGNGFKKHDDSIWRKGDPFTGDPPQEPQGLNSIFNTDYTTLKIIRNHGKKMESLLNNDKILK